MLTNPQFTADLVTFTEEILNGKLQFFVQCVSVLWYLFSQFIKKFSSTEAKFKKALFIKTPVFQDEKNFWSEIKIIFPSLISALFLDIENKTAKIYPSQLLIKAALKNSCNSL